VDITVRWSISPSKALDLFKRYPGMDWRDRAIIPIIRETIRNLIVGFTAIQTIEERGVISALMEKSLAEAFKKEASLSDAVILEAVNLRRIALPDAFVDAIESKLAAEQLAIAAEFNKTRILVIANATALSKIIEAEGIAQSKIIIANATREAIEAIASQQPGLNSTQLTSLYLYLETLRSIAEAGRGLIIVIPGEADRFLLPIPTTP
jgi:regulator of protease activity HflC (stomatin/prohibitin superfamily)